MRVGPAVRLLEHTPQVLENSLAEVFRLAAAPEPLVDLVPGDVRAELVGPFHRERGADEGQSVE